MYAVGIASLIIAAGVTWLSTPLVIRLAHRLGAVDAPGTRKVHHTPIPRIGGLAVFIGFSSGLAFAAYATGNLFPVPQVSVYWWGLALAATFVLLVGLIDDARGLCFRWKFAAQIAAATFVWLCGFRIDTLTNPLLGGSLDVGVWSLPLTVLWVVGITNAVNLIDGLDGLATGITLITTLTVGVIAFMRGEFGTAAASITLAGALAGFLRFNFNPARIFLGDSGSMFLGFVLAVTAARGSQKGPTVVALFVPLLVLGLPLMDTGLAILRRLYWLAARGVGAPSTAGYMMRNFTQIFLPDRSHIHHRLLELGLSQRRAVIVLYVVASVFAGCAFLLVMMNSALVALLLVAVLAGTLASFVAALYLRVWKIRRKTAETSGSENVAASQDEAFASGPQAKGH